MLTAQFHHYELDIILIVFLFSLALDRKLSLTLFHDVKLFFQAIFYLAINALQINNFNCLWYSQFIFSVINAPISTFGNDWSDFIFVIENFILVLIVLYSLPLHEINLRLFKRIKFNYILYPCRQFNLCFFRQCYPRKILIMKSAFIFNIKN